MQFSKYEEFCRGFGLLVVDALSTQEGRPGISGAVGKIVREKSARLALDTGAGRRIHRTQRPAHRDGRRRRTGAGIHQIETKESRVMDNQKYAFVIGISLWIYQEAKLRREYGWLNRTIIDAKGFEEMLHWPDAKAEEMCLPGMN